MALVVPMYKLHARIGHKHSGLLVGRDASGQDAALAVGVGRFGGGEGVIVTPAVPLYKASARTDDRLNRLRAAAGRQEILSRHIKQQGLPLGESGTSWRG